MVGAACAAAAERTGAWVSSPSFRTSGRTMSPLALPYPRRWERVKARCQLHRAVVAVPGAIRERDGDVGGLLLEGKVLGGVDIEGKHGVVVREDRGGAVPLVHVAIDDQDAARPALRLHRARGDCRVVEDAEPLAPVGE